MTRIKPEKQVVLSARATCFDVSIFLVGGDAEKFRSEKNLISTTLFYFKHGGCSVLPCLANISSARARRAYIGLRIHDAVLIT